MRPYTAAGLVRWVKRLDERILPVDRLNIGPRLIVCFVFIILSMLGGDAVVLWQFHLARAQAERLNRADQRLVAVLRVHASLLAFHDRLEQLGESEDAGRVAKEAEPLRSAVLEATERAVVALKLFPPDIQRDPTILPTLQVIQVTLPSQLDAITSLAGLGDAKAVRARLANQIHPLESLTSALVEKVDYEVGEEQAQTAQSLRRVERRVFMIVPMTAVFTLLIAATLGLAITRSITKPLERLVEGSKALARGEFQHQVAVSGQDEITHVSTVFNETAGKLRELYDGLRKLASLVENSTDLIGMASLEGEILFVNEAGRTIVGLTGKEQRPGTKILDYVAELERERFNNDVLPAVFKDGRWEGETLFRHFKTGESISMWQYIFFITDEGSGRRLALATICRDITERKRTQEFLQQVQADLARANRVMVVGEMAASIAHEVNQPLTGIVAHAGTGLRWLAANPPDIEEARHALEFILRDGHRAAGVIARIRALVEKVPPRRERLDINTAILEVIALSSPELHRNQVELRSQLANGLPPVPADRVQLQQVILNLIVNASEAMSEAAHLPRELVVASGASEANEVFIEVRDSGPGFGVADPRHIFDSFYTTKSDGMGMGLSISRTIVEAHGGRLSASPNQPHGAVFRFTLPVEDDRTS
jgi:two-component system, LuxR family, sensor kinase FixL